MKKTILLTLLAFASSPLVKGQNNCPATPHYSHFDTCTYITTSTPDIATKGEGIWLPEGTVINKYGNPEFPISIPDNRPTWAISIAHAWNYSRNVLGKVSYPSISTSLATVMQETELRCDADAKWGDNISSPTGIPWSNIYEDGCFQIEGSNNGSSYGYLQQIYPERFIQDSHPQIIGGANFETSALTKAYYDLTASRLAEYRFGWKFFESIENTSESYAYEKSVASIYNGGSYSFVSAEGFYNRSQDNNSYWTGLPSTTAAYSENIADLISVLDNNTSYGITTFTKAGSTFNGYYNEDIQWSNITTYLDTIQKFYHEIDFDNDVKPTVFNAYTSIAGDTNTTIEFTKLGPVIDAIILALPKEDPIQAVITSTYLPNGPNGNNCSGEIITYGYIKPVNYSDTIQLGQLLELKANIEGAITNELNYKWYEDNGNTKTIISTEKSLIHTPENIGSYTYSLEICNDNECYVTNKTYGVVVLPTNIVLTTTSKSPYCSLSNNGEINLSISTSLTSSYIIQLNGPTNQTVNTTSTTTTFSNLKEGLYEIMVVDLNTNDTAYSFINLETTTESTEQLSSSNTIENCEAEMSVSIEPTEKTSCQYTIRGGAVFNIGGTYSYSTGWEESVNSVIETNSYSISSQATNENYQWGPNNWDTGNLMILLLDLKNKETVKLNMLLKSSPGVSTNLQDYQFEIFNENNELIKTSILDKNSLNVDTPYFIDSIVVQCAIEEVDSYTFDWSPEAYSEISTITTSSSLAQVLKNEDKTYQVDITNSTDVKCQTIKEFVVPRDINCTTLHTESEEEVSTLLFPNPVKNTLFINNDIKSYSIHNTNGQLLLEGNKNEIDLSILNNGLYYIRVVTSNEVITQSFIKQ